MQAYGNAALALLLCVGSNTIGIATIPFFLQAMLSSSTDVSLDAVDLLIKLVIGILVPLTIGKLLLNIPAIQRFTKNQKTVLKLLNNGSLIMVLWQSISRAQVWPRAVLLFVLLLLSLQRLPSLHFIPTDEQDPGLQSGMLSTVCRSMYAYCEVIALEAWHRPLCYCRSHTLGIARPSLPIGQRVVCDPRPWPERIQIPSRVSIMGSPVRWFLVALQGVYCIPYHTSSAFGVALARAQAVSQVFSLC